MVVERQQRKADLHMLRSWQLVQRQCVRMVWLLKTSIRGQLLGMQRQRFDVQSRGSMFPTARWCLLGCSTQPVTAGLFDWVTWRASEGRRFRCEQSAFPGVTGTDELRPGHADAV